MRIKVIIGAIAAVLVFAPPLVSYAGPECKGILAKVEGPLKGVDFPRSGTDAVRRKTITGGLYPLSYTTITLDGLEYLTFLGPPVEDSSEKPMPLFIGDAIAGSELRPIGSYEFNLSGVQVKPEGDEFRWYIPRLETLNILIGREFQKVGLSQSVFVVGDNDGAGADRESYWRALSQRTLIVSIESLRHSSHDMIDHLPGYILFAMEEPELWSEATSLMSKSFAFLDAHYPLRVSKYASTIQGEDRGDSDSKNLTEEEASLVNNILLQIETLTDYFEDETTGYELETIEVEIFEDIETIVERLGRHLNELIELKKNK